MEKLNPDAWALVGDDELDARDNVQEVDAVMIYAYVLAEDELPHYSARPFAAWLNKHWPGFTDDTRDGLLTNRDVVFGALEDWCGGRTK